MESDASSQRRSGTIRPIIEQRITDEFVRPHLLGPDGPKRQLLFKIFDTNDGTKGPDDKATQRRISSVTDASIRFREYGIPDIHFEPHNMGTRSGGLTGQSLRDFASRLHPSFDGIAIAPQPRPYCFGCTSFFHPFDFDITQTIALPHCKRFPSENSVMQTCSRCKVVTYCSVECQTKDWNGEVYDNKVGTKCVSHRKICKALIKDFYNSFQAIVTDETYNLPTSRVIDPKQIYDVFAHRLKIWAKHHHELIIALTRKTLDVPIYEWLPEVNVTSITLREDDLASPYGSIATGARTTSLQPEIAHVPKTFDSEFHKFRYRSNIFHVVKVVRGGLSMLHAFLQNQTSSPPKNTSNPEFDAQELINIGYHPVIIIAHLGQGGTVAHLEHVKIPEILECEDLEYLSIGRLIALNSRGNFTTLKQTRPILEDFVVESDDE